MTLQSYYCYWNVGRGGTLNLGQVDYPKSTWKRFLQKELQHFLNDILWNVSQSIFTLNYQLFNNTSMFTMETLPISVTCVWDWMHQPAVNMVNERNFCWLKIFNDEIDFK